MTKIFVLVLGVLFLSSGAGIWVKKSFSLSADKYSVPYGFAALLFGMQLLYYPVQYFFLSSTWIMILSSSLFLILFIYSLIHIREIIAEVLKIETLWAVFGLVCFCTVFYKLSISMDLSDSQVYLNYITQNIDIEKLNYFDFWTGKIGPATEPFYLFQGYYHFCSYLCWLINVPFTMLHAGGFVENIATITWGMGMIYSVVSTLFFVEIVSFFKIKSKLFSFLLTAFLTFYFNFYYWRVGYAFYGNTFRTLFVGVLLLMLVKKYYCQENIHVLAFSIPIGAGLASSSSFLFISFDMVYVLMAYLYYKKIPEAFKDLSLIVFPIVLFTVGFISYYSIFASVFIMLLAGFYYLVMNTRIASSIIHKIDDFLNHYGYILFVVIVPLILVAYSFILSQDPYYLSRYSHYFGDHSSYDMYHDPFGIYANNLERVICAVQWIGYFVIVIKSWKNSNFVSFFLLGSFLIFLTPLTTPAIAKLYADFVYYRAFDILFNPFTEALYFVAVVTVLGQKKFIRFCVFILLIVSVTLMHSGYFDVINGYSSYSYLQQLGNDINPIFKITDEDYLLFVEMRDLELIDESEQMTILSHAEGLRTFFPNTYQIFSRRQFFDASVRVNEEFYQIAKRHYGWLEPVETDYSKACKYIREYEVDLAVINYYENWDFDQATDACMDTVYSSGNYHVKVMRDVGE